MPFDIDDLAALILLLGAVFVNLGVKLQARMSAQLLKTISGIVPICAHCKRIRTAESLDEEQDNWAPVESYVMERTPAKFTHNLCPQS